MRNLCNAKTVKVFFHLNCSKFNEIVFDSLVSSGTQNEIIWCCTMCRPKVRKVMGLIDAMDEKLKDIEKTITAFRASVENRLELVENKLNEKSSEVKTLVDSKIETINKNIYEKNKSNEENIQRVKTLEEKINFQNEQADRERRIKNIVFYNIPECISNDPNARMNRTAVKYAIYSNKISLLLMLNK